MHLRADSGSIRDIYEQLCRRLGHREVAEITGKALATVRAYCNPNNSRQVKVPDMQRLDRYMWLEYGEAPFFGTLYKAPPGECWEEERKQACG